MTAQITFNPMITSNASGSFSIESDGFIQGTAMDDPSARYRLRSGYLADSETIPMWGGVGISENVAGPAGNLLANTALQGGIVRATSIQGASAPANGQLTGFSVFDQAHNMITTPQSPVPLAASRMTLNLYPLGSLARIALACDPSLVDVEGNIITQLVSWDFTNQRVVPYSPAYVQGTITGAVWASTSGGQVTFTVGTDYTTMLNAGDDINVADVVNTGGASTSAFNGAWTVVSLDATHIVVAAPASATIGTYASGGHVLAGGGALPVKILRANIGNSMTVSYDTATGFATWNRSGSCLLVQI